MKILFWKMSGAGNDFVVIDNRRLKIRRRRALARQLCERTEGIGADGMILIEPSKRFAYRMRYFNADGSDGGMCGNGGRCAGWFAFVHRIAGPEHTFEALGRPYGVQISGEERIRLSLPDPGPLRTFASPPAGRARTGRVAAFIDTGSPHVVMRVAKNQLTSVPIEKIGPAIRHDRRFQPAGTNVNVVEILGGKRLRMRTYERGVEAETRACGTGSVACAIAGVSLWGLEAPVTVHTSSGERLLVGFRMTAGGPRNVSLTGSARVTFVGGIDA